MKAQIDPNFLKKVKDTVSHYSMIKNGESVLVGVSGGPDSVLLLAALVELKKQLGIKKIVIANIDHGIRGEASRSDSLFVKNLAIKHDIEFAHKKVNVKNNRPKGRSLEEEARKKRYAFFAAAAKKYNCVVLATGHTMDDQAETVIMRLILGTGIAGLSGIPPVRMEGALRIIRPLIRTEKIEIHKTLNLAGIASVEDSTNFETDYFRNKVRHEILPFLEKYNPRLKRSLTNLSDTLREDLLFIEGEKEKVLKKHVASKRGKTIAMISELILQPKTIRKEIFKELFSRAGGNIKRLTYRHWMDMDRLITSGRTGSSLDFPGNVRIKRATDSVEFIKK